VQNERISCSDDDAGGGSVSTNRQAAEALEDRLPLTEECTQLMNIMGKSIVTAKSSNAPRTGL
jgi:hypothetical protein